MARVDQRVEDVAGAVIVDEAVAGGAEVARDGAAGMLSSFNGLDLGGGGEAGAEQRGEETRRGRGAADAPAARAPEMAARGGGAEMDVVPAWAMVVREGPIPDVAPPPLTTRARNEAVRATLETAAAADGESD